MIDKPANPLASLIARARELKTEGVEHRLAMNMAILEERIKVWPAEWGDELRAIVYGDFTTPSADLNFPSLGIIIEHTPTKDSVIRGPMTVLNARVAVRERSVGAVTDAANRLHLLLGALCLDTWGNIALGWWCWLTHDPPSGAIMELSSGGIDRIADAVRTLPDPIRQKLLGALFWVRDPRSPMLHAYGDDTLRIYASYWNAFECLVDAVSLLSPPPRLRRDEKQNRLNELLAANDGKIDTAFIARCFEEVVNPRWSAKAAHALTVCFGEDGRAYHHQCFHIHPNTERLYDIRNSINHGSIDATSKEALLRVEARCSVLWEMVWRMFGCLVPIAAPAGSIKASGADVSVV